MIIETWRWRFVVLLLGVALIWTGGYGMIYPDDFLINIFYNPDSDFFMLLNKIATAAAFGLTALAGLLLSILVGHSIRKGMEIEREKKAIASKKIIKTMIAYIIIFLLLGLLVIATQYLLRGKLEQIPFKASSK